MATHSTSDPMAPFRAIDRQFELNVAEGKLDRLVEDFYATDAQVMPAHHPPVQGKPAIRDFFKSLFDAGLKGIKLDTTQVEIGW